MKIVIGYSGYPFPCLPNVGLDLPDARSFFRKAPVEESEKISGYLSHERCGRVVTFVSPIRDPFCNKFLCDYAVRTDGTYFWADVLSHLVIEYLLPVPREFHEHIQGKNYSPPDLGLKYPDGNYSAERDEEFTVFYDRVAPYSKKLNSLVEDIVRKVPGHENHFL